MVQNFVFPKMITVSEQEINIESFSKSWKSEILTLAEKISEKYRVSDEQRFVVAIGGPSGSSKSTTSVLLEEIINEQTDLNALHVSLDGYHFSEEYLEKQRDEEGFPLVEHKGRYDSFDVSALKRDLLAFKRGEHLSFPKYSRKNHDPIQNALECTEKEMVLILEGLWLLYGQEPWSELASLYDYTVFFESSSVFRKKNTVERHIRGGRPLAESEAFYDKSDVENDQLIMGDVIKHDLEIEIGD